MEIKIKINEKQRLAYIPRSLYNILGSKVNAAPDRAAVLLYSENVSIDAALKSLELIKADLLHAKDLANEAQQHFCGECGHWSRKCLKGYMMLKNSKTPTCKEFILGVHVQ